MRKLDTLVIEFKYMYKLINKTEHNCTYEMQKLHVNSRKLRHTTDEQGNSSAEGEGDKHEV
jgi:hypothetical protein